MKQIVMIVIWSLALQVVACGQEQTKQSIIKIKDVRDSQDSGLVKIKIPPFESVRFRFLPEKEKRRLSVKFKIRNGNKLEKSGVFPTVSYIKDSNDITIREDVEGIVTYTYGGVRREKNNGFFKAEFYRNEDSIPFKIIYLEDSIPFKKQEYKNLKDENQQIEGNQLMQRQPDLSKVDRQIQNYYVDKGWHISASGYLTISYILTGTNISGQIVSKKEQLVTFDNNGLIVSKLTIDNSVTNVFITENREKMFLIFGGPSSDDPYDPFLATFRLYDTKTNKILYQEQSNKEKGAVGAILEISPNLIGVLFSNKNRLIRFFDISSNIIYSRTFTDDENTKIEFSRINSYENPYEKYLYKTEKY